LSDPEKYEVILTKDLSKNVVLDSSRKIGLSLS